MGYVDKCRQLLNFINTKSAREEVSIDLVREIIAKHAQIMDAAGIDMLELDHPLAPKLCRTSLHVMTNILKEKAPRLLEEFRNNQSKGL